MLIIKHRGPLKIAWLPTALLCILCAFVQFFFTPRATEAAPQDLSTIIPSFSLLLIGSQCSVSADEYHDKYALSYKGLDYFAPAMVTDRYLLPQLSDREFNALSHEQKLLVADKLLSTLFFGFSQHELEGLIQSGHFLCTIRSGLTERKNSVVQVEEYILDEEFFFHDEYYEDEIHDILARLYVMDHLDEYFLHNWIAYILTQTILFSPAEELASAHLPDVANVYNWLVMDMEDDISMRYSAYLHMGSVENWRRFRSPEDNGREMLEIFLLDFDDQKVPLTATALQNWYLDDDHDSLVIGLNANTTPLSLFNTTVYDGFDYYRELVKSDAFTRGVTTRLVDFFFSADAVEQKEYVTETIARSKPDRWQDILLQIVFSKEYLLKGSRVKSAEELFYSFAKKMPFKHRRYSFRYLSDDLDSMNQAAMKYKLGKLQRTPLDTLSFANYHTFAREDLIYNNVCGEAIDDYESGSSDGWTPEMTDERHFTLLEEDPEASMISFIRYLFLHFIQRQPTQAELNLFLDQMLNGERSSYNYTFNLIRRRDNGCYDGRENAAEDILDYLSRLTEFYWLEGVQ